MKKSKNTLNNESTVNTVKGYAFFNTENEVYVDEYFSSCDEYELPYVYNDIEDAQEAIENEHGIDIEDFEIHKIEYGIKVEEKYQRKMSYVLVEND